MQKTVMTSVTTITITTVTVSARRQAALVPLHKPQHCELSPLCWLNREPQEPLHVGPEGIVKFNTKLGLEQQH